MIAKMKLIAASLVTTVGLIGFTTVSAFADDGGNGSGSWSNSNYGWGQGQQSWSNSLPPLSGQLGSQNPTMVTLSSGWNLVDQSVLDSIQSQGAQVYSDFWNGQSYQTSGNSEADGIWVYLQGGATVMMSSPSALSETTSVAANSWGMIGNPYGTSVTVTLQKGDVAYTYDPASGQYSQALTGTLSLQPGQGAWLFSAAGGTYTLGIQPPAPPSGNSGSSTVTGSVYGNSTS